jgi:trk system potassium uptake protein TrkA
LAKQAGARRALALINNTAYGPLTRSLDIDAYINPRATTVSTIMQHVRRGRIKALQAIHEGEAEVIEAEALATSPLVGRPLRDAQIPDGIIIGAVVRDDTVIFPRGETEIETGDHVVTLARRDAVRKVEQLFRVSLDYF